MEKIEPREGERFYYFYYFIILILKGETLRMSFYIKILYKQSFSSQAARPLLVDSLDLCPFPHPLPLLMALSAAKLVSFICLLAFFSVQVHARESQFFSKVPSSSSNNYVQVTPDNKEQQSLSKQQQEPTSFVPETQKTTALNKQQEPTFIPETQNGYGLYGQKNNDQFPTTTSAADVKYEPYTTPITSTPTGTFEPYTTPTTSAAVQYEPYTTPITSTPTGTFEPYKTPTTSYNNPNKYNFNNNKYYYNNNGFQTEKERLGDSKFQESGYRSNQNSYNNNNVEKKGMSDTRFLENGKYYYDVNNEKNYNPNQYQQQQNSRGYYNENTYEYNNNNFQNEENEFDELPWTRCS